MRIILAVIILGTPFFAAGQIEQFSVRELREDLAFLKMSIEKFNPALYQYNHKAEFDRLFDEIYQSIDEPLTRLEFFKAVSLLTAGAKEGHFVIGSVHNKVSKIYSGFFDGTFQYLPLGLTFLDNRAYISGSHRADSTLQKGWEVLEINGEKMGRIIERLLPFIPADGDILTAKYYKLNTNFPVLYYWYIDQPANFKLKVLPTGSSSPFTVNISATNHMAMTNRPEEGIDDEYEPKKDINEFYELKLEQALAVLKLKSFNHQLIEKYRIDPGEFYKSIFRKLADKNIKNLILDLRDNGGGSREFVRQLVPYLLKGKEEGMLYQTVSYFGQMKKYPIPKPKPYAFKGKLYVLINGGSFSNGSVIARFAKEFADATIIGEESGSRYEGFATGSAAYVNLPNTLIEIQIPRYWIKYGHQSRQNTSNRGVLPHYSIHYSIDEILNRKDKEIEKARALITGS